TETVYSGCALAFVLTVVLMVLRGRTSKIGFAIIGCCLASAVWAGASAADGFIPASTLALLDSIRLSAWLLFTVAIVTFKSDEGSGIGRGYLIGACAFCLFALARDGLTALPTDAAGVDTSEILVRIGFGVAGLLAIENLWRNTEPQRRWHV